MSGKLNWPLVIKFKTEKDLPRKERKAMNKLFKIEPHLKQVSNKDLADMTQI